MGRFDELPLSEMQYCTQYKDTKTYKAVTFGEKAVIIAQSPYFLKAVFGQIAENKGKSGFGIAKKLLFS
jgi:hypothetical protein